MLARFRETGEEDHEAARRRDAGNTAARAGWLFQRLRCVQSYLAGGFGNSSTFRSKHAKPFDPG
jgi:hypothetical protein